MIPAPTANVQRDLDIQRIEDRLLLVVVAPTVDEDDFTILLHDLLCQVEEDGCRRGVEREVNEDVVESFGPISHFLIHAVSLFTVAVRDADDHVRSSEGILHDAAMNVLMGLADTDRSRCKERCRILCSHCPPLPYRACL